MALDQFRSFFRQEYNPSVPVPPPLPNNDGTSTHGSELSVGSRFAVQFTKRPYQTLFVGRFVRDRNSQRGAFRTIVNFFLYH